jgi:peptide/nickel transport system permease protein
MLRALLDRFWVLLGVITLVFFLTALVPGDPVDVMLGERATGADREALRASLGLDKPYSRALVFLCVECYAR